MATPRLRDYQGPAVLSYGFRPFFLLGSIYAGLTIALWLPQFHGELALATRFAPIDWHIHETLFGFLPAIVTGFLFTAVPNWTGRMPIQGSPLLVLVLIWLGGRLAVSLSAHLDWIITLIADAAFLSAIMLAIAIEVIAGRNWKNLKVLVPLSLLLTANVGFHVEAHFEGVSDVSRRLAFAAATVLIMLIGGRIIPSFTRNWLAKANSNRLPATFGRFDTISLVVAVTALALWIVAPLHVITAIAMMLAAVLHFGRLFRWAGHRTIREPLVAILHLGYGFIPIVYGLLAAAWMWPDATGQIAGYHALGVGAIGVMTLSVMVRASLGHTGRPVTSTTATNVIFIAILTSAITRIAASFETGMDDTFLHLSAISWTVSFIGFAVVLGPALVTHRPR